jgi:excisionase family DNA binding protein
MTRESLPPWAADILDTLPPLLTRDDAAKRLNLSESTLDRRIVDGSLVVVKNGRRVMIPRLELVKMLVASAELGT